MTIKNQQQKIIINIRACENQNKQTENEPTNKKEQQQFKKRRPYKCNRCLKKVYVKTKLLLRSLEKKICENQYLWKISINQ